MTLDQRDYASPHMHDPDPRPDGIEAPLPNGCWRCVGCGRILPNKKPRDERANVCYDCDPGDPMGPGGWVL